MGVGDIGDNVAYFNGAYYMTLQDAIAAAQDNPTGTIILLKDFTGSLDFSNFSNSDNWDEGDDWSEPSQFIVNLNGHTFTANESIKLGDEARILIKNGTVTSTNAVSTLIENNGDLTLNNTAVDATNLKSGGFIAKNTGLSALAFQNGTSVNSNNGTINNAGGNISLWETGTFKANILLTGSQTFAYEQISLYDATIDGDLFLDSAAASNSRILNKIWIENSSFTKNAALTSDNIGKLVAYDTDGDGTWQVKLGNGESLGCVHTKESIIMAKRIKPAKTISSLS